MKGDGETKMKEESLKTYSINLSLYKVRQHDLCKITRRLLFNSVANAFFARHRCFFIVKLSSVASKSLRTDWRVRSLSLSPSSMLSNKPYVSQ